MRIQTEISVSDILAMYRNQSSRFVFICYAIANKLNQKYQFLPGEHSFCAPYHWLNSVAATGTLSHQINRQLGDFVYKLNPVLRFPHTFGEFFLLYGGRTVTINTLHGPKVITLSTSNNVFRHQILEFIVEMDPKAVFTVDLSF